MATNVIYNCWISDVMTCHKAMRTDLFRSLPLRERGWHKAQAQQQFPARHRSGAHHEAVVQLGQSQVVAALDLGPGAHRGAEAGVGRPGALHGDHQRGPATRHEVVVDECSLGEDLVLDAQGRDVTGTDAEEGQLGHVPSSRLERDGALGIQEA